MPCLVNNTLLEVIQSINMALQPKPNPGFLQSSLLSENCLKRLIPSKMVRILPETVFPSVHRSTLGSSFFKDGMIFFLELHSQYMSGTLYYIYSKIRLFK